MQNNKITILADFPLFNNKVHGGLQRKVLPLIKRLSLSFSIDIFCGEEGDFQLEHCTIYPAFARNCLFKPEYENVLRTSSDSSKILISFETATPFPLSIKKILILGGFAYDWSKQVLLSASWDRVILPSPFSKDKILEHKVPAMVISNGYNWEFLTQKKEDSTIPKQRSETKILISPHRPDMGKGHFESIILARNLLKKGINCKLLIPRQNFFLTSSDFYTELERFAEKNIPLENLIIHEWQNNDEMNYYYSSADLTLGLGTLEEGFGAFVVESIYFLTPVFARPYGAIPGLMPLNHGLFLASEKESQRTNQAFNILTTPKEKLKHMLVQGRDYIRKHYSESLMCDSYLDTINEVIHNNPPQLHESK